MVVPGNGLTEDIVLENLFAIRVLYFGGGRQVFRAYPSRRLTGLLRLGVAGDDSSTGLWLVAASSSAREGVWQTALLVFEFQTTDLLHVLLHDLAADVFRVFHLRFPRLAHGVFGYLDQN